MIDELKRFAALNECTIDDLLSDLPEVDTDTAYDESLDEMHGNIDVCGFCYSAAWVFQQVDDIAYNEGYSNWLDRQIDMEHYFESPNGNYYYYGDVENLIEALTDQLDDEADIDTREIE